MKVYKTEMEILAAPLSRNKVPFAAWYLLFLGWLVVFFCRSTIWGAKISSSLAARKLTWTKKGLFTLPYLISCHFSH